MKYIDPATGKLMTEDFYSYTKNNILGRYSSMYEFLNVWNESARKAAVIEELKSHGVFLELLRSELGQKAEGIDDLDLILETAYDMKPKTRRERAENARRSQILSKYSQECRKVLDALLDKYADSGINALEDRTTLNNPPFDVIGSPVAIANLFGGRDKYIQAVRELAQIIYSEAV